MSAAPPRPASTPPTARLRAAVTYAIRGDLRFLSHHDELRLLALALARADWPVRYSHGFNPRPRLSILPPRNLGLLSECQCATVELTEPREPAWLADSLARALPGDCVLKSVVFPLAGGGLVALASDYAVELDPRDVPAVGARLPRILSGEELVIQRECGPHKPPRPLDIRPYIESLSLDGTVLRLRLRCLQQGTARPSEVLAELGLSAETLNHHVRRTEVTWNMEFAAAGARPVSGEGMKLDCGKETAQHQQHQAQT